MSGQYFFRPQARHLSSLNRLLFTNVEQRAQDSYGFCLRLTEYWGVFNLGVCYGVEGGSHCILFERTSETPAEGFFRDLQSGESKVYKPSNVQLVFTVRPYNKL